MSHQASFKALAAAKGSTVVYHRESGGSVCPCFTPEGYRDPEWHVANPAQPKCNEQGRLNPTIISANIKAWCQPVQSSRATRLSTEYIAEMFGELQTDDHLLISPLDWLGVTLNYDDWGQAGEDYIIFNSRRFVVVNNNMLSDPSDGTPHHYEVGLRLMKLTRPNT